MCGRFSRYVGEQMVLKVFNIKNINVNIEKQYNIAPSTKVPVVNSDYDLISMYWGFQPDWQNIKEHTPTPINARDDRIESPFFNKSFQNNRCIIPATGYYEWRKVGLEKVPYHIQLSDRLLFGFAGIYSTIKSSKNGLEHRFAIITSYPRKEINFIHDRMPVIIPQASESTWLDSESTKEDLLNLLKPTNESLKYNIVSSYVNSPSNKGEECIKPLQTQNIKQDSLNNFFD
jgi:putative SOS response-associated peptidase YedK